MLALQVVGRLSLTNETLKSIAILAPTPDAP